MQDHITVRNQTLEPVSFELALEFGSRLRGHLRGQGARLRARRPAARRAAAPARAVRGTTSEQRAVRSRGSGERRARAHAGRPLSAGRRRTGRPSAIAIELEPRERWDLRVDVVAVARRRGGAAAGTPSGASATSSPTSATRSRRGSCASRSSARLGRPRARLPATRSPTSPRCGCAERGGVGKLPAAGMPWFMTVFGRDTIITCLQTLLFGPELARDGARSARRAPGDARTTRRSTPSRARSSTRCGTGRRRRTWFRALLRHGRRDAALPDPALGGLAVDRRRGVRPRPARAGAARARVDRRVRRP